MSGGVRLSLFVAVFAIAGPAAGFAQGTKPAPKTAKPPAKATAPAPKSAAPPAGDGIVHVGRETKGRKGKGVTVITGVPLAPDELQLLATRLKKRCGCGGTVNERSIEIQGDHRDLLVEELGKLGYTVRRSGG